MVEAGQLQLKELNRLDIETNEILANILKEENRQRLLMKDVMRLIGKHKELFTGAGGGASSVEAIAHAQEAVAGHVPVKAAATTTRGSMSGSTPIVKRHASFLAAALGSGGSGAAAAASKGMIDTVGEYPSALSYSLTFSTLLSAHVVSGVSM